MESPEAMLFSHDIFAAQVTGGVSRCMIELMRALDGVGYRPWQSFTGTNDNALLAEERKADWFDRHVVGHASRGGRRSALGTLANERQLRRIVSGSGTRVVHRTYHPIVDLLPSRTTVVETVHDLWDMVARDEAGPRATLRRRMKRKALERADSIICVSQSTLNYLGDTLPTLVSRAVVIPHGTRRISDRPVAIDRPRPFFLFVGKRDRYKNFSILIPALRGLPQDADLICFGGGAFSNEEQEALAQAGLSDRVRQLGGNDDVLAGYYEAACALLYPSKHEGFGLPLLEAMMHGCPVVAAPLTSLPEVGGTAALYADADDADAWTDHMRALMEDGDMRTRMIAAGHVRGERFSWVGTAQRHVALYEDLAS
ncbi:glycosyltransferase family 4 protein [Sphingomonas hankookensis]|nr:glycosyltransferase family 1 protein [Sphingomonas hankookensis]